MVDGFKRLCWYTSHCRSMLEYASEAWSPTYLTEKDRFKLVQHYFTRVLFVHGKLGEVAYVDRLSNTGLDPRSFGVYALTLECSLILYITRLIALLAFISCILYHDISILLRC